MAKLTFTGLAELQKQIAEIAELDKGEIVKKMLKEGTKEVEKMWAQDSIRLHKLTGQMAYAVKSSRVRKNKYGYYTVTYPMDYEKPDRIRRGKVYRIRNAEKAFYQHYGWTNNLTGKFVQGDRFVQKIEIKSEPAAEKVMQSVWDNYLKNKLK